MTGAAGDRLRLAAGSPSPPKGEGGWCGAHGEGAATAPAPPREGLEFLTLPGEAPRGFRGWGAGWGACGCPGADL